MKFPALLTLAAACAVALPASAQFAKPEDAVKYRQSAFTVMANHFGRIGAMVNGRAPYDAKAAVENAELVAVLAKLPAAGFGRDTDMLSPKAKSEIWTQPAKFKEHNDKMQEQMPKLVAAAKTNNLDNLKKAFAATADTCKSCHDAFRNK